MSVVLLWVIFSILYFSVGLGIVWVAARIERRILRRRFRKAFGGSATQEKADRYLREIAIRIKSFRDGQHSCSIDSLISLIADTGEKAPVTEATRNLRRDLRRLNRLCKRYERSARREFRRGQRMVQFYRFTVCEDYTAYLPGGKLNTT